MIESLKGILNKKDPTQVIIDVGGVRLGVHITLSTYEKLGDVNAEVELLTYLNVREDIMELYGFFDNSERLLFKLLTSVNGIGPKSALNILSGTNPNSFKKNIIDENGPPLDASSAWEDAERKGRWLMIYGDHLVIEGGKMNQEDFNNIIMGEPTNGGIPISKLLNVSFNNVGENVEVKASSFHRMYEVYTLKCTLSKENSEELLKELEAANVRVTNN